MTRPFVFTIAAVFASFAAFCGWAYTASLPAPNEAYLDVPAKPLAVPANAEIAVFSGGCFWGTQEAFRTVPGVLATQTGYTGGTALHPTYRTSHTKNSGYVESCEVVYDPATVKYETLLQTFFAAHDPTVPRPGSPNSIGHSYRSFIWARYAAQEKDAHTVIASLNKSGRFAFPIATQVRPSMPFYPAEVRHQNYYANRDEVAKCLR